jgi:hypothetical protein
MFIVNERIKHLAEQAGSTHKQSLGVYQFYSDELEKFAELIVLECMNICEHKGAAGLDGHYCADEIKQHFGVEE